MLRPFLRSLLCGDEREVDSVIACGVFALAALIGASIYAVVNGGASVWNPITYATGAATIIGAVAGGKTARDRYGGQQTPDPK